MFKYLKSNKLKFNLTLINKFNTRSSTIVESLFFKDFYIHTGRDFIQRQFVKKYINIKLGQLALTKSEIIHDKKDKVKRRLRALKKAERRYKHKKKK
jgi:ribosomal protein S19